MEDVKRSLKILFIVLILIVLTGCASDVFMKYPDVNDSAGKGRILVKLSEPMEKVNVSVDGRLLVEDTHTKRVEIQDVPIGERTVEIAASGEFRSRSIKFDRKITVEENKDTTILIATPPLSAGYWVFLGILMIIPWLPLLAL